MITVDDGVSAWNEIQAENGTRIIFVSVTSRGYRQFDLSVSMEKWENPKTIASYLKTYAEMLAAGRACVNNSDALDN